MSKLEKADLLEMANSYILHLQSSKVNPNPGTVSSYSLGFNACAAEVSKYVETQITASNVDDGLQARLLEHLTTFGSSKPVVEKCARDRDCARKLKQLNTEHLKPVNEADGTSSSGLEVEKKSSCADEISMSSEAIEQKPVFADEASISMYQNAVSPPPVAGNVDRDSVKVLSSSSLTHETEKNIVSRIAIDDSTSSMTTLPDGVLSTQQFIEERSKLPQKKSPLRNPLARLVSSPRRKQKTKVDKEIHHGYRSPLSSIQTAITSQSHTLPVNKQPIRKRLSAEYGRALIQKSSASCPTLNKPSVIQSNGNNVIHHLSKDYYQYSDTMKENNLVCESDVPFSRVNGADKINEMVELTTRVLTQCSNQIRYSSEARDKNNCTSLTNYHTTDNRCPVTEVARENTMAGKSRLQDEWNSGIRYNVTDRDVNDSEPVWRPW